LLTLTENTISAAGDAHGLMARPVSRVVPATHWVHWVLTPSAVSLHVQPSGMTSARTAQLSSNDRADWGAAWLPIAGEVTGADSTAAAPKMRRTASVRARKLGGAVGRGDMVGAK
jgi:hypothetical protein